MSLSLIGQKVNQYTLSERCGSSMNVYIGRDEKNKKEVVVKVALSGDSSQMKGKDAGIKIGIELSQKCVFLVRYEEVIIKAGQYFTVMEYCSKGNLAKIIEDHVKSKNPFSDEEIFRLIFHVGNAVVALHDENIVHRDLKPENIFLTFTGIYKVGDFGISRMIDPSHNKTTILMASIGYVAPEVLDGEDKLSKAMDIYSLGSIILEMIDLRHPFANERGIVQQSRVLSGKANDERPALSVALKAVRAFALSMISTDPTQRPPVAALLSLPAIVAFCSSQYIRTLSSSNNSSNCVSSASICIGTSGGLSATAEKQLAQLQKEKESALKENQMLRKEVERLQKESKQRTITPSGSAAIVSSPNPSPALSLASSPAHPPPPQQPLPPPPHSQPSLSVVDIVAKYVENKNTNIKITGTTAEGKKLDVEFSACRSMVFGNCLEGISRLTLSVTNFTGLSFGIGAVQKGDVKRILGDNPAEYHYATYPVVIYAYKCDNHKIFNRTAGDISLEKFSVGKGEAVQFAAELDNNRHTLHFFRDGKLVPGYLTHVPADCRFMFSGYMHKVRFVSLQRLSVPSPAVAVTAVAGNGGCQTMEWK